MNGRDGWMDGWVDECSCGEMDRWMKVWRPVWTDGEMGAGVVKWMDGWMSACMCANGRKDEWVNALVVK